MTEVSNLQLKFNQTAQILPDTEFVAYLRFKFGGKAEAGAILDVFEKIGRPAPETWDEFVKGTEGALVFLNRDGLVIRVSVH